MKNYVENLDQVRLIFKTFVRGTKQIKQQYTKEGVNNGAPLKEVRVGDEYPPGFQAAHSGGELHLSYHCHYC